MTGFLVTALARALCFVSLGDAEVALRRGDPRLLAVAVGSAVASGAGVECYPKRQARRKRPLQELIRTPGDHSRFLACRSRGHQW